MDLIHNKFRITGYLPLIDQYQISTHFSLQEQLQKQCYGTSFTRKFQNTTKWVFSINTQSMDSIYRWYKEKTTLKTSKQSACVYKLYPGVRVHSVSTLHDILVSVKLSFKSISLSKLNSKDIYLYVNLC